jgi:hypothetical protein
MPSLIDVVIASSIHYYGVHFDHGCSLSTIQTSCERLENPINIVELLDFFLLALQ